MHQSGSQEPQQYYMPAYMAYNPANSAEASQILTSNYGYYTGALQLGPVATGAGQASPPAATPTDIYLPQQFQNLTMSPFTPAYYPQPYADSLSPNYTVPSANASVQTTTNHTNEATGGQGSGRTSPNKFGGKRGGRGGVRAPRQNELPAASYSADSTAAAGSSEQFAGGNFVTGHFQNGPATGAASNSNTGADGAMSAPRGGYRGRGRGVFRGRGRGRGYRGGGGFGLFAPPSSTLGSGGEPTGAAGAGPQPNASYYNRALVTTVAKLKPADVQAQPLSDTQGRVNSSEIRDLDVQSPRYFVIKSFCEDDVHHSVKYGVWCSTERGNRILDFAFQSQQTNGPTPQPVYLFYSVNGSGHFCGIAEMKSRVDYTRKLGNWEQDRWRGIFDVEWIYVKDVPNSELRHILLPNNENKPVTYSRDTQEVPPTLGKLVYQVIHEYHHATSLFDDFDHYEQRERDSLSQRTPTSSSAAPNTTLGSFLVASSSEQAANVPPPADEFAPAEVPADESAAPVSAAANGADASAEEPALPDAAATNNASEPQP